MTGHQDRISGRCRFGTAVFILGIVLLTLLPLSGSLQGKDRTADYTIQTYAPGGWYTGYFLVDMDRDRLPEVLAGNRQTNSVEIWKYDRGLAKLVLQHSIAFPGQVHDIKAADLDGDYDLDIVAGLRYVGLYVATNTGGYGTIDSWRVDQIDGDYSWQVMVEDFDEDGNPDIFDAVDGGPIKIFYGDGEGNFEQGKSVGTGQEMRQPLGFNALDMNNDGRLDLIGMDAVYLRVFENPGDRASSWPSIGPDVAYGDTGDHAVGPYINPSAADPDSNGTIDQVAFQRSMPDGPVEVLLFKGSGYDWVITEQWEKVVLDTIPAVGSAGHAGVADLNGDGKLDIHVGGATYFGGLRVYLGDGLGGFLPAHLNLDHGVGGMNSLAVGDLNGDGGPDIVTSRSTLNPAGNDGFEVLFYNGPRACVPPYNANSEATLNQAIACVNAAGSGEHTINLTGDVSLTASTIPIHNAAASQITIAGNQHTITGNLKDPVFSIWGDTTLKVHDITVKSGNPGIFHITIAQDPNQPVIIENSRFTENIGEAISLGNFHWNWSVLHISDSQIDNNKGNGISCHLCRITMDRTTALANEGHGMWAWDSYPDVSSSTFALNGGQGIDTGISGVTLNNVTISGNMGYGLTCSYGHCDLTNVTISDSGPAGIYIEDANVTLANTIVYNTAGGPACEKEWNATIIDASFNLIEDDTCGDIEPGGDPLLGPLQDNGGPTWTRALRRGSPAIDGITNPLACVLDSDQRGVARPQGDFCDIGAFEFRSRVSLPAVEIIPGSGWKAGIQAQNAGGETVPITLTAYDAAGHSQTCGSKNTAVGQSANFLSYTDCAPPHSPLGSAVLSAKSQPLSSIVMMFNSNAQGTGFAGASYAGMGEDVASKTLFFPLVKHNHNGRTTTFSVQNASGTKAGITAVFRVNGLEYSKQYNNIPAFTSVTISPADAAVPGGFGQVGSLTVTGTELLAGAALEHEHNVSIAQNLQASTAFTPADFDSRLFCPLVRNEHTGRKLTSGVQVQNVAATAQTVKFTYTPVGGGAQIVRSKTVSPGASATFYAPTEGIPAGSLGAVVLEGSKNIAAVVNEQGDMPEGRSMQTTYACFAQQETSDTILIPLYKEFYLGNTTGIQIQNVSGDGKAATVTLEYRAIGPGNSSGKATFSHKTPIADGASITFWGVSILPAGSDLFASGGSPGSLQGTYGSVVVKSDRPVVAIVNESMYGLNGDASNQDSKNYEGFNVE